MKVLILFFISLTHAQEMRKSLFKKEPVHEFQNETIEKNLPLKKQKMVPAESGNLPNYLLGGRAKKPISRENHILTPSKPSKVFLERIKSGEVLNAEIPEGIIAFPDTKMKVRAIVSAGRLKGSVLLGEATLERNSKRISIEMKRLRLKNDTKEYDLSAFVYDYAKNFGIKGKHYSGEGKLFGSEILSAFAAGYADSMIERETNAFGQTQKEQSVSNATREGFANAMTRTADRFAEKIRAAPEYVAVRGPVEVEVVVIESPKLNDR